LVLLVIIPDLRKIVNILFVVSVNGSGALYCFALQVKTIKAGCYDQKDAKSNKIQ
jgi:hypothetical protein